MVGSKLALHCHRAGADVDAVIRSAPWTACKALDTVAPLQTAQQAGIPVRVLRRFGIEQLDPAAAVARWLAQDLSAVTHIQLVCEQHCSDAAWQGAVITGLAAGGYRGRYLVGAFPSGTPSTITHPYQDDQPHFDELELLYPLLRRPDVDLALDEYSGILPDDPRWAAWAPYTAQRHRLILADLARQGITCRVLITESGGDDALPVTTGGGWQTRGWSADQYVALLVALDQGDQQDAGVLARCIYTLGASSDWAGYEIASVASALAAYVRSQAPTSPPPPAKGPTVTTSDYCTQIDPAGSGEERCGPAGVASAICTLLPGNYDNYQLMRAVTAKLNDLRAAQYGPNYVQTYGSTSDDLIEVAAQFGLSGRKWTTWDEYQAASTAGEVVLAVLDNWLLRPRLYPAGAGWDALHWIRVQPLVYQGKTDGKYLLAFDPLCFVQGEYPGAYQGPACMEIASVRAAIASTPNAEAGVILRKAA